MYKVLSKFGFGESFINWIRIMYKNTISQICTNGHISEVFTLTRGVRQGCPLSAMLFVIVAECMLIAIRKCKQINGFLLPDGRESKVKAYADDTTHLYLI